MNSVILASSIVFIVFLFSCIIIYYLLNLKNLKKSRKYYEDLHKNLKKGVKVEFCGGIYGKVKDVNGDILKVEVSPGVAIEISRYTVGKIIEK